MKKYLLVLIAISLNIVACSDDQAPPRVVSTTPAAGARAVDPTLSEITVRFSEPMQDGNWSWAYTTKESFPETTGQPRFDVARTTNALPVKLEPNTRYELWINSNSFKNFKDAAGNSSKPYKLEFTTGSPS